MLELLIIGIGTGNPEHMTIQAIKALNRADVVLIPRKGAAKSDLAELRREICDRYLENPATRVVEFDLPLRDASAEYRSGVDAWHLAIAATYRDLLGDACRGRRHRGAAGLGRSLALRQHAAHPRAPARACGQPFEHAVMPGITSLQALAASHRIALNTIGGEIQVTTGRRLRAGVPDDAESVVVMLDGDCAFRDLPGDAFTIYWGAYLGHGARDRDRRPAVRGRRADRDRPRRRPARSTAGSWTPTSCGGADPRAAPTKAQRASPAQECEPTIRSDEISGHKRHHNEKVERRKQRLIGCPLWTPGAPA